MEQLREASETKQPAARGLPTYGSMALEIVDGGKDHGDEDTGSGEASTSPVQKTIEEEHPVTENKEKTEVQGKEEEQKENPPKKTSEGGSKKKKEGVSKAPFVPDYSCPASNKTTKVREDQHVCLKEQVAEWVVEKYPEHPNLRRLVTIEFLTQMAIDDLLTDEYLVDRIVERIHTTCIPT